MHKRILCGILAAVLLLSLLPAIALPVSAVDMKTSEACIVILKSMEGFAEFPYFDYSQYSIGYGTGCNPEDYPNGITEEEADRLLREYLAIAETELNIFANNHNILFSQYQFDALMLFTYNCGTGWMNTESDMRRAVINNAQGNDFLYAYVQWSNAGGQIHTGLIGRRLQEANMYLNGVYSGRPASYTYALFDGNGGTGNSNVQGYDYNLYTPVRPTPTREGYVFLGWYTEPEGGEWVRKLTASHSQCLFYAHWQGPDVSSAVGSPASYWLSPAELISREAYDAPGGTSTQTLSEDTELIVEADYVDDSGMKWGRLSTGQWVKLGNPLWGVANAPVVEVGHPVNVTGDYVNVRTGPGTTYPVVAGVVQNAVVYLTKVVAVEDVLWGKCRAGWLCLQYTDYAGGLPVEEYDDSLPQIPGTPYVPGKPQEPEKEEKVVATGTVQTNQLYIRVAAGSRGALVGSYKRGDRLELFEMTTISGVSWGRTDKGWICLTYVELDDQEEKPTPEEPKAPTEPPETTQPIEPTKPETGKQELSGVPAWVACKGSLNIRFGPGTAYDMVGSYAAGEQIRIQEIACTDGMNWGRTDLGWVCMQYVYMDDSRNMQQAEEAVVTCVGGLNIRSGAGVGYAPVGTYAGGTRIRIYGQLVVSGQRWGRCDKGWVCMDYVRLSSQAEDNAPEMPKDTIIPETTVPETTQSGQEPASRSGTITASGLNIRRVPGTSGDVIDIYRRGEKVQILETRQVNGAEWGRTDKGWICMMYVQTEKQAQTDPGFTATITADALRIRKGPGTGNTIVGAYEQDETVTILELAQVGVTLWGRTDKGWICMDYVK